MKVYRRVTPLIVILLLTTLFVGVVTIHSTIPTAAAPVKGTAMQYKGVAYTSFWHDDYTYPVANASLNALQSTGANYASVLVMWYESNNTSNTIFPDPNQTPTDAAVIQAINDAHARGMGVMLKPQVMNQSILNPTDHAAWFASYATFIDHYAKIAQANGVEMLCIGCELDQLATSNYSANWSTVISGVRAIYSGPLTYAAQWYDYENIPFWGLLDCVGIDAYFPLSNAQTPSVSNLVTAWSSYNYYGTVRNWAQEIETFQATVNKPLIFTEIGYRSADYAAQAPADIGSGYNPQAQANCYEAVLQVFSSKPWFSGMFWWNWDPNPSQLGANNTDFSPQNKLAQDVLAAYWNPNLTTTALTATATSTAFINQNFTINGTLNAGTGGIADANITLQRSTDNVTWSNVTSTATDPTSNYQFSKNESAAGTYYYRAAYDGNATYANVTSNVLSVTVQSSPTPLTVGAVGPANNATDVPITTTVNVAFNQAIQAGANYSTVTLSDGTPGPVTTSIAGTTLTITPNATLVYNTTYTLTIPHDAVENGTTTLATDFISTFTTVTAPMAATNLTATAPATASINQNFTINGTLNAGTGGIADANITLQRSTDNVTWSNVTSTATDANGTYQFSNTESAANTYYYRTAYNGNDTYVNATSTTVSVTVSAQVIPTTLTATVSTSTAYINQNFTINGTLTDTNGNPSTGAAMTLKNSTDNATWNNVTTTATDANGTYQFRNYESVANTYYYRISYDGNATYTNATSNTVNVNVTKAATVLTLTASTTAPAVSQLVNFTAALTSGTTPLSSKSVAIYHYLNGVRYSDVTATTKATGQITLTTSFASPGQRTYYATFAGNGSYLASTSSAVTVNVTKMPTALALTASNTTPIVNQQVTFTATLSSSGTHPSGESVTIYNLLNGVRYNDLTAKTGTNGQITLTTSFASPGQRTYYATFAGDTSYQSSTSSAFTVTVNAQTKVTLAASTATPAVNRYVTLTGTLSWWNPTTGKWVALSGKSIQIWHTLNGVRYNDVTGTTNASGTATFTQKFTSAGKLLYHATFAGDTSYQASTSAVITISTH